MTKLDTFFQNASKTVDVPAGKPSSMSGEGGEGETAGAFDALMKNIAEKPQGTPLQNRLVPTDGVSPRGDKDPTSDAFSLRGENGEGTLPLPDAALDLPIASKLDQQLTLLIQAGLPLQTGTASLPSATVQMEKAPASHASLMALIQFPADENADVSALQARAGAQMKASVVHQETHFKPVPTGMVQDVIKPHANALAGPVSSLSAAHANQEAAPNKAFEQIRAQAMSPETLAGAQESVKEQSSQAAASNRSGNVETGLPMAMLQRIASAVATESQQASAQEVFETQQPSNSPTHVVAKASEGVVRILNIQLHPAELGKVTVKMRLSGDTLEMELQASREETAELLRKDSEKLTSLLRTSGYRPDSVVVVTAAADTSAQDGAAGQRQQSGGQSQAGGFQNGAAHSDGQQRRSPQEAESGIHREQKSSLDEKTASSTTGDLYL